MKKLCIYKLLISLVTVLNFSTLPAHEEPKFLASKLLAMADGKAYGVTKEHIGFTLQIIYALKKMRLGKKNERGIIEGLFIYNGKTITLDELCDLEKQCKNEAHKKQIALCLHQIIEHFVKTILPFNKHAQGMKELIALLIADSCVQRHRPDSFLLTWNSCPDGKEAELLHKEMNSCAKFHQFIIDLSNFLNDFVHSCPHARNQFITMIKEKHPQHN